MAELSYEQSMSKLEKIVAQLESGELGLEESLKLFEEGTKLAADCNKALNEAEQKIYKLNGEEVEEINAI
ncbi:MAG: exodeoxyribonuclease VII small subunit [Oscillospiraceae bacterium]|nr:exodeoxyribonuclease VII small subunit [Candidatus Limimonas coprohippi]MCQ2488015.1 exodeoxyribonuclease VII small subunit [Clostridia bacterium]